MKKAIVKNMENSSITFEEAVKATMKKFDSRGKLRLYPDEMKALVESLGLQLSDDQLEAMITEADLQQRGFVDYPDFVAVCHVCGMGPVKTST